MIFWRRMHGGETASLYHSIQVVYPLFLFPILLLPPPACSLTKHIRATTRSSGIHLIGARCALRDRHRIGSPDCFLHTLRVPANLLIAEFYSHSYARASTFTPFLRHVTARRKDKSDRSARSNGERDMSAGRFEMCRICRVYGRGCREGVRILKKRCLA